MKYNPAFLADEILIQSFVARTAELEVILGVIRGNNSGSNQHLLVIGPRGIGKTTLVLRSAAELRTDPRLGGRWHPIVFGEESYQVSTPGEFWLEALFHLGQQTGGTRWQQAHEELLRERDEARLRGKAISQLMDFADEQGKRLVLIVENLHQLIGGQIDGDDAWSLRETLMNEPRLMLLGTATSRFDRIDDYGQALYEMFRIIPLQPLDQPEAQALWAASTGEAVPSNRIRPLQILTGGNPRLIRILSEFAAKTSFSSLMDDLTGLVDEHTEYFKHHLDSLAPQERKVFVVLADLWDPSTARQVAEAARLDVNTTSAMLKRLMERGAVTSPYKRGRAQYYQVAERMYNVYHLMRRRGPAASRVHAVVRFMVSIYRDDELVTTTRSLVEEARGLAIDQRRELFGVYEAIVHHARRPRLTQQIVDATRDAFATMPDAPASLLKLVGLSRETEDVDATHPTQVNSESLDNLTIEDVEDVDTLLRLANHLSTQPDRLDEAEEAFRKALARNPDHAAGWDRNAFFLFNRLHRPEQALASLDRALALDPGSAPRWSNHGLVLASLGRNQDALESYDRAIALDAESAATWYNRGVVLGSLGREQDALESYDRAIALDAENAGTWHNRGNTLSHLGREQDALDSYDRAIALDAEDAATWYNRGVVLGSLGREQDELDSYDRAITLDAEDATTWHNRGVVLSSLGREQDALDSYDRAIALDAEDAATWYNRGNALSRLGREQDALDSYDRAIALDAEDAATWYNRGNALSDLGREQDALESYDRAVALDPDDWLYRFGRGLHHRRLHRSRDAEHDLRAAMALDPDSISAPTVLTELLLEDQRASEACVLAREVLARSESPELLSALARAFFAAGVEENRDEAASWAHRAVELEPASGHARRTLASLLGAQGKWSEALEQASVFLADEDVIATALDDVIAFFIDAVAAREANEVLKVISAAGRAETFEPLVVAIRQLAGAQVDVAREILEVAADVTKRIDARRSAVRTSEMAEK
jgi:tetratricopeptide (TPR) repeat protein